MRIYLRASNLILVGPGNNRIYKIEVAACIFRVLLNARSQLLLGSGAITLCSQTGSEADKSVNLPRFFCEFVRAESRKVLGLFFGPIAIAWHELLRCSSKQSLV